MLDRRDVKVDMAAAYRHCKNFFDDVLDGDIVAAACHYFGMKNQNAFPTQNKKPKFLEQRPEAGKFVAKNILDVYVMEESTIVPDIYEDTEYMASQMASIKDMDEENRFKCSHSDCPKAYKQFHWLKCHLKNKHTVTVNINPPLHSQSHTSAKYDGVYNVAFSFMKVGLPQLYLIAFKDGGHFYKYNVVECFTTNTVCVVPHTWLTGSGEVWTVRLLTLT